MRSIYLPERDALRLAIEERTCPPYDILMAGGPAVEAHLRHCDRCRDLADADGESYAALKALSAKASPPPLETEARPGELRRVLRRAVPDIHNEHGWHNPPMVLVVEGEDSVGIKGVVRVVQVCGGLALSGPYDVPLRSVDSDVFAEPWNSWPVLISSLSRSIDEVSAEELAEVIENQKKPMPWIDEDSLLYTFRRLELNIGGFYGRHGAAQAIALLEARGSRAGQANAPSGAKILPFRSMGASERREALKSRMSAWSSASSSARDTDYALAADSRPMPLSAQERAMLDRGFGPSRSGVVNVFDLGAPADAPKSVEAEFRSIGGKLHILFAWTGSTPLEGAALLGESEEWVAPWQEREGQFAMVVEFDAEIDLASLKVLIFIGEA